MSKSTTWSATVAMVGVVLAGCASQGSTAAGKTTVPSTDGTKASHEVGAEVDSALLALEGESPDGSTASDGPVDSASLPPAPWSAEPLAPNAVPRSLVAAWRRADNRDRCAPLAPSGLESAAGRTTALDGGWAVEFDRAGAPGMRGDGSICASCGRGAFGVAGIAMSPDELAFEEEAGAEIAALASPTFRDGSRASFTPAADGEGAVAATIAVTGQDCVYQVWSFLGEDHARELVGQLRFVAVRGSKGPDRVADVRFSQD